MYYTISMFNTIFNQINMILHFGTVLVPFNYFEIVSLLLVLVLFLKAWGGLQGFAIEYFEYFE